MRKVAGGEASAVPHTTFVGHSARQSATNPMILKQGDFEESGPVPNWKEAAQYLPEAEGPELEKTLVRELTKCLNRCYEFTEELSRQGFSSGEMLGNKIGQLQQEIESLMEGGGESDLGQIIGDELSNVEVTPRDDPGRIRREGPI